MIFRQPVYECFWIFVYQNKMFLIPKSNDYLKILIKFPIWGQFYVILNDLVVFFYLHSRHYLVESIRTRIFLAVLRQF